MLKVMADHEHGQALVTQTLDDRQYPVGFLHAEGCGRLVHDDQPRVRMECPANGHGLPLSTRHDESVRVGISDAYPDPTRQDLERLFPHGRLVQDLDQAAEVRPCAFSAEKEVLDQVKCADQRQILVNRLDAKAAGGLRVRDVDLLPLEDDLARGRRMHAHDDLDKGRLAGPIVSHEGRHLASNHVNASAAQGLHAAKGLPYVPQRQQHLPRRGGGGLGRE